MIRIYGNRNLPTCVICGERYVIYKHGQEIVPAFSGKCPSCKSLEETKTYQEHLDEARKEYYSKEISVNGREVRMRKPSQGTKMNNVFRYGRICSFTGIPCGSDCSACTVPLWPADIVQMASSVYSIAKATDRRGTVTKGRGI